jgi:hypothetical protein
VTQAIHLLAQASIWLFALLTIGMVVAGVLRRAGVGRGRALGRWLTTYIEYVGHGDLREC